MQAYSVSEHVAMSWQKISIDKVNVVHTALGNFVYLMLQVFLYHTTNKKLHLLWFHMWRKAMILKRSDRNIPF